MDKSILLYKFAGNSVEQYITFTAVLVAGLILLYLFRRIIFSRIKKYADATDFQIDDLVVLSFQKNLIPLMYLAAVYIASEFLYIKSETRNWLERLLIILISFFITRFFIMLIIFLVNRFWLVKKDKEGEGSISVLLNMVIKILVWSIAVLILLDNLGVRISGLIAGLGVGGVAIAFAAQSILRDIFNYFTIFFDRPFEIGDFLVVDNFKGTVEHIGVKTTRLRSLGGEQLIFANTDLTGSRVRNYKTMQERRVVFTFGVTYQTPSAVMKKIPAEIEKIISAIDSTRFDRTHFFRFGDSSLDFEVVYYVLSDDYRVYMDIQQDINIRIMKLFEKMKVEFAYPTRTLFVNKQV